MTEYELQQVQLFMEQMQWSPAERRTRRRVPASHGDQVDLRRSLRQNIRYGGEPLVIARRPAEDTAPADNRAGRH